MAERAKPPLVINGNQSWPEWGGHCKHSHKATTTKLSYHTSSLLSSSSSSADTLQEITTSFFSSVFFCVMNGLAVALAAEAEATDVGEGVVVVGLLAAAPHGLAVFICFRHVSIAVSRTGKPSK